MEKILISNAENFISSSKFGASIYFIGTVRDLNNEVLGGFTQKLFSIGGKFDVLDKHNQVMCKLEGTWTGWDFYFRNNGKEFAHVSKKWAGLGHEMFTSADNYMLEISDNVPENDDVRKLILAAVMCIDMVLKE